MVEVKLQFADVAEMLKAMAKLNACDACKLDKALDAAIDEAVTLAEKPKRGRPAKKVEPEVAAAPVGTVTFEAPAPAPAPEAEDPLADLVAPAPAPAAPECAPCMVEEARKLMLRYIQVRKRDGALALLAKIGAAKVTDMSPQQRIAFRDAVEAEIGKE